MDGDLGFFSQPASAINLAEDKVLAQPRDLPNVKQIRLASYNVRNLFGEYPDTWSSRPSEPPSEERLQALANVVIGLDADVIAFQEVQNERVLSEFIRQRVNRRIRKEAKFTTFVLIPARDPRGINVAVATRLAARATLSFHDRDFGPEGNRNVHFSRDLLGVELYATPKYRFLLFVAHLKAKIGGDPSERKRRWEAEEIRTILKEPVFGGNPYVEQPMLLVGDMNAEADPPEEAIQILKGKADSPLSDLLASVVPNYTYPTHNKYPKTRLDYLLASRELKTKDAGIFRDDPAGEASDHYPVFVTIQTL
jgi:endonuclease/exonuclease/phosphatase family metal-dependent hydrolase